MNAEQRLCVIPARGGSKRIEKKNVRVFLGKPILAYPIEAALQSGCFQEVMVSTDDPQIAELARKFGAAVPFPRSAQTSGDATGLAEVLLEVLSQYNRLGRQFGTTACVLATAPLLAASELREAMDEFAAARCDGILSVCRYSYPIQRSLVECGGHLRMRWPRHYRSRSQDLQPSYHDAGQFYIVHTEAFLRQRRLFLRHMLKYELPETHVQDIDSEEDWKMAEQKYRFLHG
jgi:pseudaminic acid cytidylyltransferase